MESARVNCLVFSLIQNHIILNVLVHLIPNLGQTQMLTRAHTITFPILFNIYGTCCYRWCPSRMHARLTVCSASDMEFRVASGRILTSSKKAGSSCKISESVQSKHLGLAEAKWDYHDRYSSKGLQQSTPAFVVSS